MVGFAGPLGGGLPAFATFQSLQATRDVRFEQFKNDPVIKREVEYFLENAGSVDTVDDFMADRRLLQVTLSAFALEEEIQFPARIRAVLTEPLSDEDALANKLLDPRFKEIAEEMAFATLGTGKLKLNFFRQEIIDRYLTNEFEKSLGALNPALREAEFFRRKIGDVDNVFAILGEPVLRSVVTFTLGLPPQIAFQSVDKQKSLIEARLDIADFKDPEKVDEFVRRFLILKDQEATSQGLGISPTAGGNAHLLPLLQGLGGGGLNLLV